MKTLVIADHNGKTLKPGTLNTVTAARHFNDPVHVVILGNDCASVAQEAAQLEGVHKVIVFNGEGLLHLLPEALTPALLSIANEYTAILAPASTFGKNCLPRLAVNLDVMQISDVIAISSNDTFERPIYAGNVIQTIQSLDPIKVLTVRTTAFKACLQKETACPIETKGWTGENNISRFCRLDASLSDRPDLSSARIVVSGGRGVGSKENFALVEQLADCLKAGIGASRAAVDAGFVPNDYQIGQTGKVVAPDLYIAVGISGAIQHLAGMKDSKVIVAINKDPDAPIFQVADYGYVGDLFEVLPQLKEELGC